MKRRSSGEHVGADENGHQMLSGEPPREKETKVELGKKVTLLSGISVIVGIMIGAGIFISPKGILKHSGSIGMSLIVWIACGVLSLFGEFLNVFNLSHVSWWEQTLTCDEHLPNVRLQKEPIKKTLLQFSIFRLEILMC